MDEKSFLKIYDESIIAATKTTPISDLIPRDWDETPTGDETKMKKNLFIDVMKIILEPNVLTGLMMAFVVILSHEYLNKLVALAILLYSYNNRPNK